MARHRIPHNSDAVKKHISNLPQQLTSFVGREQEIEVICNLLRRPEVRLLTLTGTGGVGKTRLSLQVANALSGDFADGVYFVLLAPISDPSMVMPTIAQVLGIKESGEHLPIDQIKGVLYPRHVLVVLDNIEQVMPVAPQLEELLVACPSLKLLVTSRALLHLQGEHVYSVPPLALPNLTRLPDKEELTQYAAVTLFVQRAQAVMPTFQVTPTNARAIAEICVRLDGLPLALELAAARIRLLPPRALLSRLSQRLQVLTGGAYTLPERQQTLRNTLKWSYDLLDAQEQQLFRRLAVFVGGWTLEAAEVVGNAGQEPDRAGVAVLERMASLLDKSLLQVEQEREEPRFTMLETVREYGLDCLRESGEAEVCQRAHSLYYLTLVQEAKLHIEGEQQLVWLGRLDQEMANVSTALEAAYEYKMFADLVRGVSALAPFLILRGLYQLAERHLQRAYEAAMILGDRHGVTNALLYLGEAAYKQGNHTQAEAHFQEGLILARQIGDHELMSALLADLGSMARKRGEYTQAETYLQEGLTLARQIGNRKRISDSLTVLGSIAAARGDYGQSEAYLQEGLALAHQIGDPEQTCMLLVNLGATVGEQGNHAQAESYFQEGLRLARQIGYREFISGVLANLGETVGKQGNYAQAESYFQEGLGLARQMGHRELISTLLINLGEIVGKRGDHVQAERYLEEGLTLARQIGIPQFTSYALYEYGNLYLEQQRLEAAEASFQEMRTAIPEGCRDLIALAQYGLGRVAAAQGNIHEAQKFGMASVVALKSIGHQKAKEVGDWLDSLPDPAPTVLQASVVVQSPLLPTYPDGLTAREIEVLRLVAQGWPDAQIAAHLVISPRTVNAHLTSIYRKIQVSSRSAATRYAMEHHLV